MRAEFEDHLKLTHVKKIESQAHPLLSTLLLLDMLFSCKMMPG